MATITPTLTITSTDATSETLNLEVTDSLTVTVPAIGISRQTITTADNSTNFVILQTTGSVQYARLSPGEFCFFPVNDGNGLEARADTASCILEYAYWAKS